MLANIGTSTWIAALALQSHPNIWVSKSASYSILAVAAGLKVFYSVRNNKEKAEFMKRAGLMAEASIAQATKNTRSTDPQKSFLSRSCRKVVETSKSAKDDLISGIQKWRLEFASELVPLSSVRGP